MIFNVQVYKYYTFEADTIQEAIDLLESEEAYNIMTSTPSDESPALEVFYHNEEGDHITIPIPKY